MAAEEIVEFRAVAWNPSLAALYRVALQLLARCRQQFMNAFVDQDVVRERQLQRALAPLGSRDRTTVQVRRLVHEHRVQRGVLLQLLATHPELRAESERLQRILEGVVTLDETSESSSGEQ